MHALTSAFARYGPPPPPQVYEKEGSPDEAIENYTQAADFFASENSKVSIAGGRDGRTFVYAVMTTHTYVTDLSIHPPVRPSVRPFGQASANECLSKTAFLLTTSRGAADPSLDNYARGARIFEDVRA